MQPQLMTKGAISIPLAIAISLIGSGIMATAGYYRTISSQEVGMTKVQKDIEAQTIRNNGQDDVIKKIVGNMNIINRNMIKLLNAEGLTGEPLEI